MRARRQQQLDALGPDGLLHEVQQYQRPRWSEASLARHYVNHRRDFAALGLPVPTPEQYQRESIDTLARFRRLFTGLEPGGVTYVFAGPVTGEPRATLLVTSRGDLIRSAFPSMMLTVGLFAGAAMSR